MERASLSSPNEVILNGWLLNSPGMVSWWLGPCLVSPQWSTIRSFPPVDWQKAASIRVCCQITKIKFKQSHQFFFSGKQQTLQVMSCPLQGLGSKQVVKTLFPLAKNNVGVHLELLFPPKTTPAVTTLSYILITLNTISLQLKLHPVARTWI